MRKVLHHIAFLLRFNWTSAALIHEMKDTIPVLAFARVLRGQMLVEVVVAIKGRVVAKVANNWTREKLLVADFARDVDTDLIARNVSRRPFGLLATLQDAILVLHHDRVALKSAVRHRVIVP